MLLQLLGTQRPRAVLLTENVEEEMTDKMSGQKNEATSKKTIILGAVFTLAVFVAKRSPLDYARVYVHTTKQRSVPLAIERPWKYIV